MSVTSTEPARLLSREQAPAFVRRDFILTGYLVGVTALLLQLLTLLTAGLLACLLSHGVKMPMFNRRCSKAKNTAGRLCVSRSSSEAYVRCASSTTGPCNT